MPRSSEELLSNTFFVTAGAEEPLNNLTPWTPRMGQFSNFLHFCLTEKILTNLEMANPSKNNDFYR